ncbi:branched-chain amino acid aminotransferase [Epilithonimonas bovis DSM 19482]|uniref:Branched-chain amino acid aminotransferase n=1 Tax=Epilithonimonas bovis DSM 19482 TaxID=1121284 RepID=A0A1U7PS22_9FLAO|nr:aminotransferase class IV [Epilithonimonas bovis]MDN5627443.1 aminodeoxychorismate lyase [Weeksellaceae bacterium]SIT96366.1 branched-chain amino acid aminotransferase [Epilithonimonas bovis DSM 19482]
MQLQKLVYTEDHLQLINRAFLYGDAVWVSFFVRNGQLIMAEESYFFLMASMRKMRMNIPLSYTLEFFQALFEREVLEKGIRNGIIQMMAYRKQEEKPLPKSATAFYFEVEESEDILGIQGDIELDLIKEINVNANLLSNIRVHSAENIYATIYAKENDLDDVILLNPNKKIARSIFGNLLFLQDNVIKIPKQTEGAYISPLMENFVTFVHKNKLADIEEAEIIAFESQKAEEILRISDEKGVHSVSKIRNKTFANNRFTEMVTKWKASFDEHQTN